MGGKLIDKSNFCELRLRTKATIKKIEQCQYKQERINERLWLMLELETKQLTITPKRQRDLDIFNKQGSIRYEEKREEGY